MAENPSFHNHEMSIVHHHKPHEGTPHYIVYCKNSSRGMFSPEDIIALAEHHKLETIDEIKSFLLAQSSSRQEAQSHQEAVEQRADHQTSA